MKIAAMIMTGFVALEHIGFMILEMFMWNTPTGHKVFKLQPDFAAQTEVLASNQGLYNGFLVAGLIWSLVSGNIANQMFFLGCVVVAGIYGAYSASMNILFLQAIPAAIALALTWFASKASV